MASAMLFAELMQSPLASLVVHLLNSVMLMAVSKPLAQKPRMSPLLRNRERAHSQHQL